MPLKGGQLGVARATVTGRQLYIAPVDGVRATVDADLGHGDSNATPVGPAGCRSSAARWRSRSSIHAPGHARPHRLQGGAKRTVVEAYDPSLDAVALGVDVHARAPLHIRNNLVDAQLAIDPAWHPRHGTNQRIGLRGELTTMPGGRFRVFANDFEVQKGDDPLRRPDAHRSARRHHRVTEYRRYSNTVSTRHGANTTGGAGATAGNISSGGRGGGLWRITLHAYGDTEDLQVDMTSDPALSREDIFFLLTIGLTRAEVDQVRAGSVYASAAFEAIGTVSGADRAVKTGDPGDRRLPLRQRYSPRTGRTEPQVTLGRRLDRQRPRERIDRPRPRIASSARTSSGASAGRSASQTSYDNISTVSSGSVGNFGLDFRWRIEFD